MPDDPQNPDSLGDDRTFAGEQDAPPEERQSLGDAATHAGGVDSSISDLADLGEAVDSDLPLIDLAARYEMEGDLGKGGMGVVQLATDRQLKRKVAIKRILASSQSALKRFVTEAQSIAALNHFNIVQIYEFGRDADGPLLVLEYVSGGSLLDRLQDGKLELDDAISITCQLCDALTLAHQKGIIHRDIKPANILLTEEGIPKLTDFGLARDQRADDGQTVTGAVMGTLDFMPPEQRQDATAVDARSDLWSLAATCYQMLTGDVPRVIDLDAIPPNLRSTFAKALKQNPDKRFSTAEQFKTDLRKGTAPAAAPVAGDMADGICPSCNTANDASRRFCQQCAEPLIVPCLSCSQEITVWHNVCGRCGCKQDERRDLIRDNLAAVIEESLTLARGHQYEKALVQLMIVQGDQHAFTGDIREQASEQITLVTAQRDEQYQLRDRLIELANQHRSAHDYAAAVRDLEEIPSPLYTDDILNQLLAITATRDELSSLQQDINSAIKDNRIAGLLEKTTRFLQLSPGHSKFQKLHGYVLQRASRVAELLGLAEQQYDRFDDEAVLTTVAEWPQALERPARVKQLQKMATDRLARVEQLKDQVAGTIRPAIKLRLVDEYLQLRPGDKQMQDLPRQIRHKKKRIIVGSCLAVSLLVLVSGLWIFFSYQSRAAVAARRAAAEKHARDTVVRFSHGGNVDSMAFSPDGKRIVSGSEDGAVKVWDAETGREMLTLEGHAYPVSSVSFSPDGKWIVSGGEDRTLKIWDAESGQEIWDTGPGEILNDYELGEPGEEPPEYWDAEDDMPEGGDPQAASNPDSSVFPREIPRGAGPPVFDFGSDSVSRVAFNPNGKQIAIVSDAGTVTVWQGESGRAKLMERRWDEEWNDGMAFSPDGQKIVIGRNDNTATVWDVESGRKIFTLVGLSFKSDAPQRPGDIVNRIDFSPDGKRIVRISEDGKVKVLDAETGKETLTLEGRPGLAMSVSFSPDGKRIVSSNRDKTVKVWDAETGREMLTLEGHTGSVFSVAYSPVGTRIISQDHGEDHSGDRNVRIWDADSGRLVLILGDVLDSSHSGTLLRNFQMAFSLDDKWIVSSNRGNKPKVWDSETGLQVLRLSHSGYVSSVAFSPDGERIASGGMDGIVRVWDVSPITADEGG
jgi:WD40 repeat protein/serine/threonine protein kinase